MSSDCDSRYAMGSQRFVLWVFVICRVAMSSAESSGNGSCLIQVVQPVLEPGTTVSLTQQGVADFSNATSSAIDVITNALAMSARDLRVYWTSTSDRRASLLQQSSVLKRGAEVSLEDLINGFQNNNSNAEDSCHARLLESRHLLDNVHAQVLALQEQMMAKQSIIHSLELKLTEDRAILPPIEMRHTEALQKCARIRRESAQRYVTLSAELLELRQIASPEVTIDDSAKVVRTQSQSSGQLDSSASQSPHISLLSVAQRSTSAAAQHLQARESLLDCVRAASASGGLDSQPAAASQEDCLEQLQWVQRNFTSAYVSVTRDVTDANHKRMDMTCDTIANTTLQRERDPVMLQITQTSEFLQEAIVDLQDLESELRRLQAAYLELEQHSVQIKTRCAAGEEVSSYLQTIHDIIQDVKKCPGYDRVDLSIATFRGFAEFSQSLAEDLDTQDRAMDAACSGVGGGQAARATWHHELQANAILGLPRLPGTAHKVGNTASHELMGKCRSGDCAVTQGARLCWASGAPIMLANLTQNCTSGRRVVACVVDQKPPTA